MKELITTPDDIRGVKYVGDNVSDPKKLYPYILEVEQTVIIDALGASLYKYFLEADREANTTEYNGVTISKEQLDIILNGGFYENGSTCDGGDYHSGGLIPAIAYLSYATALMSSGVNFTAFGVKQKQSPNSTEVSDGVLIRESNRVKKIGLAYLDKSKKCMSSFGLIQCVCSPKRSNIFESIVSTTPGNRRKL